MRGSDSPVRGDGRILNVVAALLLASVVVAGATTAVAASGATVSANPATTGETSTHTVTMTVGSDAAGSSLDHIRVDYSAGSDAADVSDVGVEDVIRFGADRDGDGEIEDSALGGSTTASGSNNGETLTLQNSSGPTNLESGDVVIAEFRDVGNPDSAGEYAVQLGLNGAETASASYEVTSPSTATATETETATATATETHTETATATETETSADGGQSSVETTDSPTVTATETTTSTTTTETEPASATEPSTATEEATDAESTPAAQQQMARSGAAPVFGPAKAGFVLAASLVAGVIWVLKVRP